MIPLSSGDTRTFAFLTRMRRPLPRSNLVIVGYVTGIDMEEGELEIAFDDRPVVYSFSDLDRVVLAYATTIHKAQGSEYPAIVIPVTKQHYMMLRRNLLYTGVTRGKRLVILVGDKRAVAIAVKGTAGRRRWSKLQEWLSPDMATAGTQKRVAKEDGLARHAL